MVAGVARRLSARRCSKHLVGRRS
ncbi:hypothetical protein LINPERHAP1_LOCUS35640 [Linum perenne]